MTDEKNKDRDLENYLEGKDGLMQEYRLVSIEVPPSHLDEAILASSRKAVGAKPGQVPVRSYNRWHIPVSIAAVIVLSTLVVFNLPDEQTRLRFEPAIESETGAISNTGEREAGVVDDRPEALSIPTGEIQPGALPQEGQFRSLSESLVPQFSEPQAAVMPEARSDESGMTMDLGQPVLSPPGPGADTALEQSAKDMDLEETVRRQSVETEGRMLMRGREEQGFEQRPEEISEDQAVTGSAGDSNIETAKQTQLSECSLPRPEICTMEYMPVCGVRDTGIRCVTTPCDSTEMVDFANACNACGDPAVIGYLPGRCDRGRE